MRARQILIALVVLAVVAVLLVVFGKPRSGSRETGTAAGTLVVPGFTPGEASLIEVSKSGAETVRVRKTGDDWTVESAWGYPADPERVHSLLQAIQELRVSGVRSRRAASHADFQLDKAQGLWVRVCGANDKELAKVCVGKSVAYDSCFVRTGNSNDVLEVKPNLLQDLGAEGEHTPRPVFFVNKTVLTYQPNDVQRLTLERESGTVVLEKVVTQQPGVNTATGEEQATPAAQWMIRQPEEEEADENACMSIVNGLSSIIAPDIGGGKTAEECGLAPPKAKVTIEFTQASGKPPVTVLFGSSPQEMNRYYAMTGAEGARIFVVSVYYWNFATKDLNDLRKVKREEPAAGTASPEQPKPEEQPPAEKTPSTGSEPDKTPPETKPAPDHPSPDAG